jgi:uncharacterized phosphosugar-binding protein
MSIILSFYQELTRQLALQFEQEADSMQHAAKLMSDCIAADGLVHVFGSGHSQMFAMELFYRSGGLVPINALLYPQMAVAPMAKMSSVFERMEGFAKSALDLENIGPHDVMIIASVSGRNGSTVDVALAAKAKNIPIIALTSKTYSEAVPSRHSSTKRLFELADVVIDLKCPLGDASMSIDGVASKFASTSSILGMAVLEALVSQTVKNLVESGVNPPLWVSANLESKQGEAINQAHVSKYKNRIRFL